MPLSWGACVCGDFFIPCCVGTTRAAHRSKTHTEKTVDAHCCTRDEEDYEPYTLVAQPLESGLGLYELYDIRIEDAAAAQQQYNSSVCQPLSQTSGTLPSRKQ